MVDGTLFYGIRIKNKNQIPDITEHLAMNGYTYDTNGEDVLFVYHEEVDYILTILDDHNIKYEII